MDAERWERMQAAFHAALAQPPEERRPFLEAACADEPGLAEDVLALLDADDGDGLLDRGLAHLAADVLEDAAAVPRQIGPYRVHSVLGQGGMGTVYLAERDDLGRRVALKVLRDGALSPARRARFIQEEKTLAQLRHPAIARLYDAAVLPDGTPYFVMEHVEGVPLTTYCAERRCSVRERLRLFRAVCEAVQHAHQRLVVHRDLKPSNILVTGAGEVKLLDFGIARRLEGPQDLTRTALRLMTPSYAAPEQLRGEPVGVHTDVYALGVVLYELLAGRRPFDLAGLSPGQAEALLLDGEPEKPSAVAETTAGLGRAAWADLDVLCLTAMHKDPQRRYPTVEALVRDLDHFLKGEPLEARPDSWTYRAGKFFRRRRRPVIAAALAMAAAVGFVAFHSVRLADARDAAVAQAARTDRIQQFMLGLFTGGDEAAGPADSLRVVTLIERGVREARVLDGEPALQAELFHTLGTISQQLGDFERADSLLQAALARRRAALGPDHPDVALSLLALGRLRVEQAALNEAERLVREGLEVSRQRLPAGHPAVADAVAALGEVLQERGEYDRAIGLLEEAVRMRAAHGSEGPELSRTLTELANTHFYAGHYATADSLNQLALALDQRLFGRRHPFVANSLVNLGATRFQLGDYAEAEAFYRQALAISLAYYGEDHPETAAKLLMLGQTLAYQERYDEALEVLRPALAVRERVYGPDHPRVATVLNELGTVALRQGDPASAEAHYRCVVGIYRDAHGEQHYYVGVGLSNLASALRAGEQYDQAEAAMREAIAIFTEALGADHINTAIAQLKLGALLVVVGRHAEAEVPLLTGYDVLAPQMEATNRWLVDARADLAAVYTALGQPEQIARFRAALNTATPDVPWAFGLGGEAERATSRAVDASAGVDDLDRDENGSRKE